MHARSRRIPIRPATFWRSPAADPSDGSATPASTIASVDARETHLHRGDGRSPSGSRSSRCVPISPKGRTQIRFENHCGCAHRQRQDQHAPEHADHEHEPPSRVLGAAEQPRASRRSRTRARPAGTQSELTADATDSESSASLMPVRTRPPTTATAASANSAHASSRSLDACCVRSLTGGPFEEDGFTVPSLVRGFEGESMSDRGGWKHHRPGTRSPESAIGGGRASARP